MYSYCKYSLATSKYQFLTIFIELDILFHQITTFTKVRMVFVFGLQTPWLIDFTKIFRLKSLKPKNKGPANFYECCDLRKKVYLIVIVYLLYFTRLQKGRDEIPNCWVLFPGPLFCRFTLGIGKICWKTSSLGYSFPCSIIQHGM